MSSILSLAVMSYVEISPWNLLLMSFKDTGVRETFAVDTPNKSGDPPQQLNLVKPRWPVWAWRSAGRRVGLPGAWARGWWTEGRRDRRRADWWCARSWSSSSGSPPSETPPSRSHSLPCAASAPIGLLQLLSYAEIIFILNLPLLFKQLTLFISICITDFTFDSRP